MPMPEKKLKKTLNAMIRLLDEPDEKLYATIRMQILALGIEAIPELEEAESNFPGSIITQRLEEIIYTLRTNDTFEKLKLWAATQSHHLLDAWILISSYLSPDDDPEKQKESVSKLYRDVWVEMNQDLTALEKIRVVNHVFYNVYQYGALQEKKAMVPAYLLGNVLRMQRGNPLSLGMLYLIIARRLGLPVYGVNLPRHFILAYTNGSSLPVPAKSIQEKDILFYINPFNKGAIFRKSEIELYLKQLRITPQDKFFLPCSNIEIIRRLLHELAVILRKQPLHPKAKGIESFLSALKAGPA